MGSQVVEITSTCNIRLHTHVKKLRSKLGEEGNLIKTIWGMGYKMDETAE